MLSWMIEIRMEIHSLSDNICNIVVLYLPFLFYFQRLRNSVRLHPVLVVLHGPFMISIEQDK